MIPLAESGCFILTPAMIKAVRRVNIGHLGNMAVLVAVIIWEHVVGLQMVQNIGRIVPLATRRARHAREAALAAVQRVTRGARRRTFTTAGGETTVTNALRTHTATTVRAMITSVSLATRRARHAREAALAAVRRVTLWARRRTFTTVGWETTVTNALRTHTAITGTIVILGHLARTRVRRDQVLHA
jgi:hypothetical protein